MENIAIIYIVLLEFIFLAIFIFLLHISNKKRNEGIKELKKQAINYGMNVYKMSILTYATEKGIDISISEIDKIAGKINKYRE